MKKLLFVTLLALPLGLFAQLGQTYGKGVWNISAGAGFPNKTHTGINAATTLLQIDGSKNGSSTPFFMLSSSYGITQNIGIGVYVGYFKSESEMVAAANALSLLLGSNKTYGTAKYSVFSAGGKLTYHSQLFPDLPQLDIYASTYLGWNFVKDEIQINLGNNATVELPIIGEVNLNKAATTLARNINYPKISYEINVGGKYAITPNWNIYAEAGFGRFLVNAGITYSIPSRAKEKKE